MHLCNKAGGRTIWSKHGEKLPNELHLIQPTHCVETLQALLATLVGPVHSKALIDHISNVKPLQMDMHLWVDEISSCIDKNGAQLTDYSSFYAYPFLLSSGSPRVSSHCFLMMQYKDGKRVGYRLFQSFLDAYSLREDIDNEKNVFSEDGFKVLLDGLKLLLSSEKWTRELEQLFDHFFHTKSGLQEGTANLYCNGNLRFQALPFTLENITRYQTEFEALKATTTFQEIISKAIL